MLAGSVLSVQSRNERARSSSCGCLSRSTGSEQTDCYPFASGSWEERPGGVVSPWYIQSGLVRRVGVLEEENNQGQEQTKRWCLTRSSD